MKKRIAAGMIGGVIGVTGALGVYGGMTVRAAQEEKQAKAYLAETMYWTEVRQLETALTGGNRLGAYHRAMSAAEDAAGAGYGDDAAFFRAIPVGLPMVQRILTKLPGR